MSKYTTKIKDWLEFKTGLYEKPYNEVIENGIDYIFDFSFPFYNDEKLEDFKKMIVIHFYMREIGFETFPLFKLNLNETLNRIMPYYNKMYEAVEKEFNFLDTENIEEITEGSSNSNSKINDNTITESNQGTENLYSDTPQGSIDNIKSGKYLNNVSINSVNSNGRGETNSNTDNKSKMNEKKTIKGYRGYSPADLLSKMYTGYKNINDMVLKELDILFMGVW